MYKNQNPLNKIIKKDFFDKYLSEGFAFKIDIREKNKERFMSATFFPVQNQRKVKEIRTEKKTEIIKDYDIKNNLKSFQTGLIFKDTHYYETQRVIPKNRKVEYKRDVTYYTDGSVNYGDWREC